MRAFLNKVDENGAILIGGTNSRVSPEYKLKQNLMHWAREQMKTLWPGYRARLEVFHNWERRYGKPNEVITLEVE